MITGLLSPSSGTITYPPDLLAPYRRELGPYRVAPRIQYKEGNEETYLADLLNLIETRRRYALRLMQDHPWDVLMVHFIALDNLQHAFWKFVDPDHPRHQPERAARFGPGLLRAYQQVDAADMPEHRADGAVIRAIAGDAGPVRLHTPVEYLDVALQAESVFARPVPEGYRGFVYIVDGAADVSGSRLAAGDACLTEDMPGVAIRATETVRFMWCFGKPHGEPIVQHGTFVD